MYIYIFTFLWFLNCDSGKPFHTCVRKQNCRHHALKTSARSSKGMPIDLIPSQMIKADRLRRQPLMNPTEKGGKMPESAAG